LTPSVVALLLASTSASDLPEEEQASPVHSEPGPFALTGSLLGGLGVPAGVAAPVFAAELGMDYWLPQEPFVVGASGRMRLEGLTAGIGADVRAGFGDVDERWPNYRRRAYSLLALGGVVFSSDGAPGWRAGLTGRLALGGILFGSGANAVRTGLAAAVLAVGGLAALLLGPFFFVVPIPVLVLLTANEVELSYEVLYPHGAPPTRSTKLLIGYAF